MFLSNQQSVVNQTILYSYYVKYSVSVIDILGRICYLKIMLSQIILNITSVYFFSLFVGGFSVAIR